MVTDIRLSSVRLNLMSNESKAIDSTNYFHFSKDKAKYYAGKNLQPDISGIRSKYTSSKTLNGYGR